MAVTATSTNATTSATASATTNKVSLADNFDSFLKLLTTQLQSQDPLSPMDASQFTQQLVQFSGVEQSIKTNSTLSQLVSLLQAGQSAQAIDYLGATVEVDGSAIQLGAQGEPRINYALDGAAQEVTISIRNEQGQLVAIRTGQASAGQHSMRWDGLGLDGRRAPAGLYSVEVTAKDAADRAVGVSTTTTGVVDAVELKDGKLMLSVDGVMVPLDALLSVSRTTAAGASSATADTTAASPASAPAATTDTSPADESGVVPDALTGLI
jgi:flagellar basal-body rod modification protein FlgD